ncbi:MAG TPA: hypothetical protein VM261_35910 [Kofleriaceae bacterium]|nr:hypothetical protein [Kofleriaceae bacterium]
MVDDDEIIKAANKFFGSVGSALKKGAQSAAKAGKTVTGVGRGSVRVTVDSGKATPGGDVRGKVFLELNEPVDAKKLVVELRASQRVFDARGGVRALATTTTTIYRFESELSGARSYHKEELPFTLTVPRDTGTRPQAPAGRIGDVARAVSSVVQPTTGPVEWRVVATLVISFGRDLEHAVDIAVV